MRLYSEQGLIKAFRKQDGTIYRSRFGVESKARIERYADRVRIIRATTARGEVRHKAAGETGTATKTAAGGNYYTTEKTETEYIIL